MKPTVLIGATTCWVPTARLVLALAKAGFAVDAVCPRRHALRVTSVARQYYPYHGLRPLNSFIYAIKSARPDLVIPGDDLAARHLHELYYREECRGKDGRRTCTLIERSLGAPQSFPLLYARAALMKLANEEGLSAPKTEVIAGRAALQSWTERVGFPTVLKADNSSGGIGVRIVRSDEEAARALRVLGSPPLLARAMKRAAVDRDTTLVWDSILRRRRVVNGQVYLEGREATSAVACWKGSILAETHFEVVSKMYPTGAATVLRTTERADMSVTVEKMVRRLALSGIHGFDFLIEADTGKTQLIEINPRAPQVGHLALGERRDLAAALYSAVSGEPVRESAKITNQDTIVLFPHEWNRDPDSPYLRSGYHDIPWEEPRLVVACLRKRVKRDASDGTEVPKGELFVMQRHSHGRPAEQRGTRASVRAAGSDRVHNGID